MRQMDRYLWFLLINVLLVTTITGKFYDTMYLLATSPPIVLFLLLGSSIPIMSGFFLQYLIVKACIGLSMEINRGLAALQVTGKAAVRTLCKFARVPCLTMSTSALDDTTTS